MDSDDIADDILNTKLYLPRPHPLVTRERLHEELDAARSASLATIVAGAGYGKSMLAADFILNAGAPYAWYRLEAADRDPFVFISYLVASLRLVQGQLGARTLRRLHSTDNVLLESRRVLSTLISEIDTHVKHEVFVVLDDFHQVNDSAPVTSAMEFLLGHMPPNIHIMILSRSRLNLDLAELAARRELIELGEADLCFTPDETSRLFSEIFAMPLKDEYVRRLCELTEGWVSGLVLFYHALKSKSEYQVQEAIRDFEAPAAQVTAYLSKAVYADQSDIIKEFLLTSSVLSRINPAFCDELMEIDNSREILNYLKDERLFTLPLDDRGDWYRFHSLMKSFLLSLLKENLSGPEIKELNRRAAVLWEGHNQPEQALAHYLKADDYGKAADVLESIAQRLMEELRISFLHDHLNLLPEEVLAKHPWLVFYLAETSDILGDYHRALELYGDATRLFYEPGDVEIQVLSLLLSARLLNTLGRYDEAGEMMVRARGITPEGSPYWNVLMAFRSITSSLSGISDLAEKCLEDALYRSDEIEDEATRASLLYWCGFAAYLQSDFKRAREILLEACELAERNDLSAVLLQLYAYLSQTDMILGRWEEAVEYAERGTCLGERFGSETPFAFACRSNRGGALCMLGDHEKALRDAEIAGSLAERYGPCIETFNTEIMVGWTYKITGNNRDALAHFRKAERIGRERKYREAELFAQILVVYATLGELALDAARKEIEADIELLEGTSIAFTLTYARLLLAAVELAMGRKEDALQTLDKAGEITERYGGLGFWDCICCGFDDSMRLLPLLSDIFGDGRHLELMGRAMKCIGPASLPYLDKLARGRESAVKKKAGELIETISREASKPLRINMLGLFEVVKGEEMIPNENWTSKKALSILKYLSAQRGGNLVPKDVLQELMWPHSPPHAASKNLNMALSTLRRTLEPRAARGQSSYLVVCGDSVRLELGRGGKVDFRSFRDEISRARDAKLLRDYDLYLDSLLAAERLYRGDFLEEDLYVDWCRSERERLREEYIRLLSDICGEYRRRRRNEEALLYSGKAIEADPGQESLYRKQMEIYGAVGDSAGIERTYDRCRRYLMDAYNVSPSSETERVYLGLRNNA